MSAHLCSKSVKKCNDLHTKYIVISRSPQVVWGVLSLVLNLDHATQQKGIINIVQEIIVFVQGSVGSEGWF